MFFNNHIDLKFSICNSNSPIKAIAFNSEFYAVAQQPWIYVYNKETNEFKNKLKLDDNVQSIWMDDETIVSVSTIKEFKVINYKKII